MKPVKGENSDLVIKGMNIHVQTEDWGPEKAVLISRVFKSGGVHKTFKLPYEKIEKAELESQRLRAVAKLHKMVVDWAYKEI